MKKKLNSAQLCARELLKIAVMLRTIADTDFFSEEEQKKFWHIHDDLAKQRDKIVGIINSKPFPDLDVLVEEIDIDAALAGIEAAL